MTHYEVLEAFPAASLVDVRLETGRTHQIRVHFSPSATPASATLTYGADPTLAARLGVSAAVAARRPARFRPPGRRPVGGVHAATTRPTSPAR